MLSFSFQDDLLQFDVNLVAANEAHLRVSSKLLALARRVVSERDHRGWRKRKRIRTTRDRRMRQSMQTLAARRAAGCWKLEATLGPRRSESLETSS